MRISNGFTHQILCVMFVLVRASAQTYRAAVMEYKSAREPTAIPSEVINSNTRKYLNIIEDVQKKGANIVVFPENGLTSNEPNTKQIIHLSSYSLTVPEPGGPVLCDKDVKIISNISCAAKQHGIYVVVNVVEREEDGSNNKFYSTDVVFDSNGKIIERCRKRHLYDQTNFNKGKDDGMCSFTATFGGNKVNFGLLIGPDILFYKPPSNVRNVILSTSIRNILPVMYSLSLHSGYALANSVNLLVSGYTDTNEGYGGTGTYFSNGTATVLLTDTDMPDSIISDIPIAPEDKDKKVHVTSRQPVQLSNIPSEDFKLDYASAPISVGEEVKCKIKGINTEFKYLYFDSGERSFLNNSANYSVCAIVNTTAKGLRSVSIEFPINMKNSVVIPISLGSSMLPFDYSYSSYEKEGKVIIDVESSTTEKAEIFGFLVTVKNFSPPIPSLSSINCSTLTLLIILLHMLFYI